ncbi:MAG: hypothetical protein JKY37_15625 [Nannocystaceae bacterium]|nr:hypothetical protein [Nannocystaceae bacterium]
MSRLPNETLLGLICLTAAAVGGCKDDDAGGGEMRSDVTFDAGASQIQVVLTRGLAGGETLHTRVRQGQAGELDCTVMAGDIPKIGDNEIKADAPTFGGPTVDPMIFEAAYDANWLEVGEPTPEMLAQLEAGQYFIDVCVMDGDTVVRQDEFDARRALDRAGGDGKFDADSDEVLIASTEAYADACVAKLGEIPFFPKLDNGDYDTFNCLDAIPIPSKVTQEDGTVVDVRENTNVCDEVMYLSPSKCEPTAVPGEINGPRVISATNDEGTSWVLLCRKTGEEEGVYNDIAMIGSNPFTGETCFFQNALFSRNDGQNVPHPGDRQDTAASPETSTHIWSGIHGGLGSGIQCASCHSTDAFVHTPWIDGARFPNGETVVPKMGEHENFALGFNDAPYKLVNGSGQGWTMPESLVSAEVAACTKCHRVADDRWSDNWFDRMDGSSTSWNAKITPAYKSFEHTFWMPPEVEGLDEESWGDSEFAKAMDFARMCANDHDAEGCEWAPLPTSAISEDGELPTIDLTGRELAREALKAFGAPIEDPECPDGNCETRRCAECHAVSRVGMQNWETFTRHAWDICDVGTDPAEMTPAEARLAIECLRTDPNNPDSAYAAEHLGVLTTGVQYTHFRKLFLQAFGEDDWIVEYAKFKARVSMPKGNHPKFSQFEYAVVEKWFADGIPNLEDVLEEEPPPQTCVASADPDLTEHINAMAIEGWSAVNEQNGVRNFGCPDGGDVADCFASGFTDRTSRWGTDAGSLKELTKLAFTTSFWTRTSADGRFVGNGGGSFGATVTDLQTGKDIGIKASFDPGFFPDNSGFMFQGGGNGAGICNQSLLLTEDNIDFTEDGCIRQSGINLYQHVARGLNGGDYFIINSQFTSDSGSSNNDPTAGFVANSTMKFTPMIFDGTSYRAQDPVIVGSPFEGDSVLSPSGRMVISRIAGPGGRSLGYSIREVSVTPSGDTSIFNISNELATVCLEGAKANISYDERFFVTHHYEDGGANIYIVDMLTGEQRKVTNLGSGVKALFPHFVSSGWFYFLVRDGGEEFVVASDAALQLAAL